MIENSTTGINLVSLCSEQLWPTIHSLAYFGQRIQKLFLLHTNDDLKSGRPARSIAKFLMSWNPDITVVLPKVSPENSSAGISRTLHEWMDEHPNCDWVINASGGTKLMLLGVLDFASIKNVEVIYRDLTGKPGETWHSVKRVEEFGFLKNTPIPIEENCTDLIPVETLVKTIWSDSGNFHVEVGIPPPALDVEQITKYASLNSWNFKKAFQASGYPSQLSSGLLFEQYVSSIMVNLGIKNITCNAVRKTPLNKAVSEIDIIVNHQGKLTIIDCKMRSLEDENDGKVETLFDQIRKSHQVGSELGGLGAQVVLLRPNRILSENELMLARSYRIEVFDAPKMPTIIDGFAKFFGVVKIPTHLLNVQKIIQASQENQFYPGMGPAPFKNDWDLQTRSTGIINLNSLLGKLQNDLNQDWAAFELDNEIHMDFTIPKNLLNLPGDKLKSVLGDKFARILGHYADVKHIEIFKSKGRISLRPFPGKINETRKSLQRRYGKPIL